MKDNAEKKQELTEEQVMDWYNKKIAMDTLRRDLAKINCEIAEYDCRRLEAIVKTAHLSVQKPAAPATHKVEVTQEILDDNPELAESGVKVGDVIEVENHDKQE